MLSSDETLELIYCDQIGCFEVLSTYRTPSRTPMAKSVVVVIGVTYHPLVSFIKSPEYIARFVPWVT